MKKMTILALMAASGVCGASSTIWTPDDERVPQIEVSSSDNWNVETSSDEGVPQIETSSSGVIYDNDALATGQDDAVFQSNHNWATTETGTNGNFSGSSLPEMDPAMREWFNANLPKSEHAELFGKMLGTWATATTFRMEPNAPAETTYGTCTNSAALQRFVQHDMNSELMPGMRFQGKAMFGFNNTTREYECVWLDSTSTGMTVAKGQKNSNGSITWTSTMTDPSTGEQVRTKSVTNFEGSDKMRYTIYANAMDGSEFAALEIVYTKVTQHADRVQQDNERQRRASEAKLRLQQGRHSNAGDR
jgi:hypothetical protein